jgi:hypothetical protein
MQRTPPLGYECVESPESTVWIKPSHGEALRHLSWVFDPVWATTWEHKANMIIGRRLALTCFGHRIQRGSRRRDLETPAVRRFVGDRPFVWVDDELVLDAYRWAEGLSQPYRLVRPMAILGVTDEQLHEIESFGRSLAAQ